MVQPNPGSHEPWLEKREHIAGYEPPEEYSDPGLEELEEVADTLEAVQELEQHLYDFYSKAQRQGVAERLEEIGHEKEEEFLVLKKMEDGFQVEDRFVLDERREVLEQTLPEYRRRIMEDVGELVAFGEDDEGEKFYRPLREALDVLDHGVENEYGLEQKLQELDRDDRDIIRHYVENRKGHGQRHSDPMDEFVTRDDQYALDKLLGDVQTIALEGVEGLEGIAEEYRSWGREMAQEMERRRLVRRQDEEPVEPWKYKLTTTEEDVDYIY
ncbi:MAG: hypothetical protein SVU32_02570 [Candidatus Nanohaloarchaea archaeon]|nr:hypothetical protein [Candidatus Nanohaloarchaea archaeon]